MISFRRFSAPAAIERVMSTEIIAGMVLRSELDLEDEWFEVASGQWRPIWTLGGVSLPAFWDCLQQRRGLQLAERRQRVLRGEMSRGEYVAWRSTQLTRQASEGVATIVGAVDAAPAPAESELRPDEGLPAHIWRTYELVREIGQGGVGRVLLVRNRHTDARYALKVTRPGLPRQTVLNELRAMEKVRSPNVVSVRYYEPIDEDPTGRWLIVSDYVDGPTLHQYRQSKPGGRVSDPGVIRELLLGIARGLADLHARGVVHRDLKPANIVLRVDGSPGSMPEPVIIDLGMSRDTGGGVTVLGGTPGYQSPEQEAGEHCSAASDVFVFGLVAYELVTGRRLAGARLLRLDVVCPGLPSALDSLVKERCAVDEVSDRLADGAALLGALEQIFDDFLVVDGPAEAAHQVGELIAPVGGEIDGQPPALREEPAQSVGPMASKPLDQGADDLPAELIERGYQFERGVRGDRDEFRAAVIYRRAAELGDARGMGEWGRVLLEGIGVSIDKPEAVWWLRRAAEAGVPDAMHLLGQCIEAGDGTDKSQAAALDWYLKASECGHAPSMVRIAKLGDAGIRSPRDRQSPREWLFNAAKAGHVGAMVGVGLSMKLGRGVRRDEPSAVAWFRRAAEAGNSGGMNQLGLMLECGCGVAKDEAGAGAWYRSAAELGLPEAMHNLGRCLVDGIGMRRDQRAAAEWFLRAAGEGCVDAMFESGKCAEEGIGVVKDPGKAREWYSRGAAAGCARSMFALAKIEESLGRRDAAIKWYRGAAKAGNQESERELRRLLGRLGWMLDMLWGR